MTWILSFIINPGVVHIYSVVYIFNIPTAGGSPDNLRDLLVGALDKLNALILIYDKYVE